MTDESSIARKQGLVKAAGWFYLGIIVTSILSLIFLGGQYDELGNSKATISNMLQHSMLVRINSAYEVLMFSSVIVLAVLLYEITKSINPALARSAMLLRVAEAVFGFVGTILTLGALNVAEGNGGGSLAIVLYDLKDIAYKIVMVCISLGTLGFFYLFYKARYLPTFICLWGIIGFGLMLLSGLLQILDLQAGAILNIFAAALAITFELFVGAWLITKGITQQAQ